MRNILFFQECEDTAPQVAHTHTSGATILHV